MRIVVEGYDATGKSTLVKALAAKLGLDTHVAGPPPANDSIAIMNCAQQLQMDNIVHDRITCISRQAYQLDSSNAHIVALQKFVHLFQYLDTIFIYAYYVSDVHNVKSYDTEEHIRHITDNRNRICDNYDNLFMKIPHIKFNFTKDSIEDILCEIAKYSCKHTKTSCLEVTK